MIERGFLGKQYPAFWVVLSEAFVREIRNLLREHGCPDTSPQSPPLNWPAIMTLHGSACLLGVWEDLGVDPLAVRLVREEYLHLGAVVYGEQLSGRVTIEDLTEHVTRDGAIEEQVDLTVPFHDASGGLIATYRCAFRVPVAVPFSRKKSGGRGKKN